MNSDGLRFDDAMKVIKSGQVWEYQTAWQGTCGDVPDETFAALQGPRDFPPLEAAIVSGDRVALAVDPNVPDVVGVIQGAVKAVGQTDAAEIEIVVWDEASDALLAAIEEEVGKGIAVMRHLSRDRESLRYVGADPAANPIYLNRWLVDADFVLPIVAARPRDLHGHVDLTGVFPALADAASRQRHFQQSFAAMAATAEPAADPSEAASLLGVQIMLSVSGNPRGEAAQIMAGTPASIRKALAPPRRKPDEFPPPASLVIASTDGNFQQQSWCNVARAAAAATRYAQPGATIVLWTAVEEDPPGQIADVSEAEKWQPADEAEMLNEDGFPDWDESIRWAEALASVAAEHRLLVHSRLPAETIEGMGLGSIESADELARLTVGFDSCGVLRAAQFADTGERLL